MKEAIEEAGKGQCLTSGPYEGLGCALGCHCQYSPLRACYQGPETMPLDPSGAKQWMKWHYAGECYIPWYTYVCVPSAILLISVVLIVCIKRMTKNREDDAGGY